MGSTSALRGIILAAAVVLGIYGLANAFPDTGGHALASNPGGTHPTTSPTPTASRRPSPTPSRSKKSLTKNVTVQILNGSGTTGLAAQTNQTLQGRHLGFTLLSPANAPSRSATTTIYYKPGFKDSAEYLASKLFSSALIKQSTNAGFQADLSVWLGTDFAASA